MDVALALAHGGRVMRLDRYIGTTVFSATLLAWLVVAALEAVFMLIGELGDLGRGDYRVAEAASFVLMSLPARAYQAFPMAVLIGTLMGLGNLAAQRELDALQLAGCRPARIAAAVLRTGVILVGIALLLGEWLAPHSEQRAQALRSEAIFTDISVQPDAGFWVRDGRRFIRVGRSEADGSLSDITVYSLAQGARLVEVARAQRAQPEAGGWRLEGLRSSRFTGARVHIRGATAERWPALIDARLARLLTRDAATLPLTALRTYIDYLSAGGADVSLYRLNYWQRWAAPLAALAMLLLAVALVLGVLRARPLAQRLLIAVLGGLAFRN